MLTFIAICAGLIVALLWRVGTVLGERWALQDRQHQALLVALDRLRPYDERLYDACGERVML